MFWKKWKKKERIETVDLTENGFVINYNGEITQFEWNEIDKLTGFKFDRFTIDEICLNIKAENKIAITTEDFIGWRKFIPLLLILALLGVGLGFLPPLRVYRYYNDGNIELAATFLGFVSALVFILYIIRQLRFNSFRIHHRIPFQKSIFIFFAFWFISLLFSLIPFIPFKTVSYRAKSYLNHISKDFEADQKTLYNGNVFFAADPIINGKREDYNTIVASKSEKPLSKINNTFSRKTFNLIFKKDSVLINTIRNRFGYYNYSIKFPITISKTAALQRIADFVAVSKKYDIQLAETDPEIIYTKRKVFNEKIQEDNDVFLKFK